MKRSSFAILCMVVGSRVWAATPSADEVLRQADAIRMPTGDVTVLASVVSHDSAGRQNKASYEVLMKGHENTLIKTLSPATDRGNSMLMKDQDLWLFLPGVEKPLRIALQQRLMGEVSNGDLARVNFVGDYTPKIAGQGKGYYELELKAVSEKVTYDRVQLWVEKGTYRPIRAAFYASSGRLLKVGSYKDYALMCGVMRPSHLVFDDAVEIGKQSTIIYEGMTVTSHPDKLFTKEYLKKLKY